MGTLLSPDLEFLAGVAASYPETVAVSADPVTLPGFRVLSASEWNSDDPRSYRNALIYTGNPADEAVLFPVKFLFRSFDDCPPAIADLFALWKHDHLALQDTPFGAILVADGSQAPARMPAADRHGGGRSQGEPQSRALGREARAPVGPRRALSLEVPGAHVPAGRSRNQRRALSMSAIWRRALAPPRAAVDVQTFKDLDHASRRLTQLQRSLDQLLSSCKDVTADADEDVRRLGSLLGATARESQCLADLVRQQNQTQGHMGDIDNHSNRIQYEMALLEDKSRETHELVDNFLTRVAQIR